MQRSYFFPLVFGKKNRHIKLEISKILEGTMVMVFVTVCVDYECVMMLNSEINTV